jgi:hypothetical protein
MGRGRRIEIPFDGSRLVEEANGPASLLLLEQGNHGCANLAPLHRQATADLAAEQLGAQVSQPAL